MRLHREAMCCLVASGDIQGRFTPAHAKCLLIASLSAFLLLFIVRHHCYCRGLEGSVANYAASTSATAFTVTTPTCSAASPFPSYNQWHHHAPILWDLDEPHCPPRKAWCYPVNLLLIGSSVVLVAMWFYNMFLRCQGHTWSAWLTMTTKLPFPTVPDLQQAKLLFLHNLPSGVRNWFMPSRMQVYDPLKDSVAPPLRPIARYSRKGRRSVNPTKKWMACLFTVLCTMSTTSAFTQASTQDFSNHVKQFRSFQGELQTHKLSHQDLIQVQHRIKATSSAIEVATKHSPNVVTGIVDTGCSHSAVNSFQLVDPATIRRLRNPITLGGIAGSLVMEYVAITNLETFDDDGHTIPFQEQVFVNEQLPNNLFSPQAFLSHNANGGKGALPIEAFDADAIAARTSNLPNTEAHFRVF